MKIGEYPRMSSIEDDDVFVFSKPSDGTKSITAEALLRYLAERMSGATTEAVIETIFPVGSVYISSVNTDPGTFLTGTWELLHTSPLTNIIGTFTEASSTVTLDLSSDPSYIWKRVS